MHSKSVAKTCQLQIRVGCVSQLNVNAHALIVVFSATTVASLLVAVALPHLTRELCCARQVYTATLGSWSCYGFPLVGSHSKGTTLGPYTEKCLVQVQHEMIFENGTAGMQGAHSWGGAS